MEAPQRAQPNNQLLNSQSILFATALLLPGLLPSLFGWLSVLLAIPVCYLLCMNGQKKGLLLVRNGVLLAVAAAIILKLLPSTLFSMTMVPLGYSFSKSYDNSKDEIQTGLHGIAILTLTWLVFWIGYGSIQETNPYQYLLEILDTGFAQTYAYYLKDTTLPPENIIQLEQAVNELRRIIPTILPGILFCTIVTTVWINLVFSSNILARLKTAPSPWKKYSYWRLPDKLIWVLIAAGILLLIGQGLLNQAAFAIFIASALLYFFQGLAIFIYMLDKWKVPVYLRILIYGILILQSYGLVLLTLLGITDVWFNFRRKQTIDKPNGD